MEAKGSDKANVINFRAPNIFQNIPLSRIIIFCLLLRSKSLLHASTPSLVSISVDYHLVSHSAISEYLTRDANLYEHNTDR